MRILLINPPYQTITSNIGVGHQVPLGLLMVGGALIDAGHDVSLLDAECERLSDCDIVRFVREAQPDVVLTGHAGSTPAHPVCVRMLAAIKREWPHIRTVYGGPYPTYHAAAILNAERCVDFIIRGEGEAGAVNLIRAIARGDGVDDVAGITYRDEAGIARTTPDRPPIADLDAYRVGWELIEHWDRYQCFGLGRAAIVQFSRGCPHRCTYCGQHEYWVKWRRRDPVKVVDEIEWLRRTHDVRFVTLADENPTTDRTLWKRFLQELADRKLGVHFFATLRAADIVRDADLLPLYRSAGMLYVLMGIDATTPDLLEQVRKRSTTRIDLQACRLLKQNGIFSILGYIVGLQDETRESLRAATRQLIAYDGDYLNAMYLTPHGWTPQSDAVRHVPRVEHDQQKWDYRHQVLQHEELTPWQLFWGVKRMELRFHLRHVTKLFTESDPLRRRQRWWTLRHIGSVWLCEAGEFVWRWVRGRVGVRSMVDQTRRSLPLRVLHDQST